MFYREEYQVVVANSAVAALSVLSKQKIDLLVSNQLMPGMSGAEFLQQVDHQFPEIVKILMTGYADIESLLDIIDQCNVINLLPKPWKNE